MSPGAPPRELADGKLLVDEPADGVVRLTISNPAKRNALDHPILDAISATLQELSGVGGSPSNARCVMVTGAHGMFSAGYDIGEIPEDEFEERAERLVAHPFTLAIDALEAFPHPTLAALPGHTIGGGLELALACDLRVAQAGIKLGMPPAKLGLVYSHTGLRRFIDAIGAARTRELFLLGSYIDAPTALAWGLVNRVGRGGGARRGGARAGGRAGGQRTAVADGQQARNRCAAAGGGRAAGGRRTGADRAAPLVVRLAGSARGDARVRRAASCALARGIDPRHAPRRRGD